MNWQYFEKEPDAVNISVEDLVKNGCKDQPCFLYLFVAEIDAQL